MQSEIVNITVTDTTLVKRYSQGDSDAMETLILRYHDRIYNLILKMCTNADDAAELTQEAFVKVMDNINNFEGRSGFYTWLFRIAINLTISYCQNRIRHEFISLDAEHTGYNDYAKVTLKEFLCDKDSHDPSAIAQNKELCQIIINLLMKLNTGQRAVILLRNTEGMSYAQIANILNIKLGTVKSRISRARTALREVIDVLLCDNAVGESKYLNVAK